MRKVSPLVVLLLVALCAAGGFMFVQNSRNTEAMRTLQQSDEATRLRFGQAINDIASIQDSLNAISLLDGSGAMLSSPLSDERRLSATHGDAVLARVAEVRAGIERARDRIQLLETRLKQTGGHVAGLERMVTRLKQGLADKESLMAQLTGRVDSLQTNVNGLTATVQEGETRIAAQDATIEERRRELGTVFYVIGTRQELLKRGVVVARGGVLGRGKTLEPSGHVDESSFTALDTDQLTVIPITAAHARVLTPQPAESYSLEAIPGTVAGQDRKSVV